MDNPIEILITLPFPKHLTRPIEDISPRLKISVYKAKDPDEVPSEIWERVEVLYTNKVVPSLEQAPNLRWIQFHWAGIDHIIDHPTVNNPKIIATTLSGAAATQMAEYIVMMILSLGHRLPDLMANQRNEEWPEDRWERFLPLELRDSIVGIVGYGSVGRQVAHLLLPFGAKILATKRDAKKPEDDDYSPENIGDPKGRYFHRIYPPQALNSMLSECDFVVVSLPKTPQTMSMISVEEFASMKPNAFLIDVSRGGIVDHQALLGALQGSRISGAALDVFPEEPLPADSLLWKLPNVIITPHISGVTSHYDERAIDLFAENMHRYIQGSPLCNRIIPERGY